LEDEDGIHVGGERSCVEADLVTLDTGRAAFEHGAAGEDRLDPPGRGIETDGVADHDPSDGLGGDDETVDAGLGGHRDAALVDADDPGGHQLR
jgi:hypothetical protein